MKNERLVGIVVLLAACGSGGGFRTGIDAPDMASSWMQQQQGGDDGGTVSTGNPDDMASTGSSGGLCGTLAPPSLAACCTSCSSGSSKCQSNGCYGGWYCDTSTCKCKSPPSSCGSSGTPDDMAGGPPPTFDAGPLPTGSVGPGGGKVSKLYFAVIGDTRPANEDDTANYPTAVIEKIYADLAAMNPPPQFIVTTGDYQFSNPNGSQAQAQIGLYMTAQKQYPGTVFAAMGNHECTGATASNCAGAPTNNMKAWMSAMVTPLGKSTPYYSVPIEDENGQWTAKIVVVACNAWDSTQYSWLQTQLATPTTYTFVVRHEPLGTSGAPCVSEMDALLSKSKYDLFIVGHSHEYRRNGTNEVIIGNGGAPLASGGTYGYGIIEQTGSGFTVTQYDSQSAMPIGSFTVN